MQSTTAVWDIASIGPEQIVKTSLERCERALREAGMEVEIDMAPNLPRLHVNVHLMNSCLDNLIQNSVRYAAGGRWMAVRAKTVTGPEGERVQIMVQDRGPGISPVDLPHIFEPFFRGKQGRGSQGFGVGLGLTLVKRVVEAHHGIVEVETSNGNGTTFSLFLPVRSGSAGSLDGRST
jgi:signal transduction histidine kinase